MSSHHPTASSRPGDHSVRRHARAIPLATSPPIASMRQVFSFFTPSSLYHVPGNRYRVVALWVAARIVAVPPPPAGAVADVGASPSPPPRPGRPVYAKVMPSSDRIRNAGFPYGFALRVPAPPAGSAVRRPVTLRKTMAATYPSRSPTRYPRPVFLQTSFQRPAGHAGDRKEFRIEVIAATDFSPAQPADRRWLIGYIIIGGIAGGWPADSQGRRLGHLDGHRDRHRRCLLGGFLTELFRRHRGGRPMPPFLTALLGSVILLSIVRMVQQKTWRRITPGGPRHRA